MNLLDRTCRAIRPGDQAAAQAAQTRLDRLTKPRGSLGRLEELACRYASIVGRPDPAAPTRRAVVVMAADHGITAAGVSAYPTEVTGQMVRNFAGGGAAINVLARQAGARVLVVDMGVRADLSDVAGLVRHPLGPGTANFLDGPAMSRDVALHGIEIGIEIVDGLHADGVDLLAIGEMGIGNTTAASAITASITRAEPALVTGRGTGIDESARRRKIEVIEQALRRHRAELGDPLGVLAAVGGFEIAGLAGVLLGAAARRLPVLLDGFITGSAALIAGRLCPDAIDSWIASHRSSEPGHRVILDRLGLRPLLELDLRLGEGTGAVLAMPLVEASLRILAEMATFASAGVADTGA